MNTTDESQESSCGAALTTVAFSCGLHGEEIRPPLFKLRRSAVEVATAGVDLLHLVKVAAADVGADVAVETLGISVKGQRLACVSHL